LLLDRAPCSAAIKHRVIRPMLHRASSTLVSPSLHRFGKYALPSRSMFPGALDRRFLSTGVDDYKAYLLDMDGVLHQFWKPLPGAKEFLEHLVSQAVPFAVITNECRYTKVALQAKLTNILDSQIPLGQIYTAADSMKDFILFNLKRGWSGNVFVIGEAGMQEGILDALSEYPDCQMVLANNWSQTPVHCDYVCVGTVATGGPNDNWLGAECASTFLKNGAKLLYSNPDWFEITADGAYKFGCPMPTVNLLKQTTGCSAYNVGKPNPFMLRKAHNALIDTVLQPLSMAQRPFVRGHVDFSDVLFVGDSLNTDVRTAIENGIDVALMMSGTCTHAQLQQSALVPNHVYEDIQALHLALRDGSLKRRAL